VASNMAWSGYHSLDFVDVLLLVAEPVVVVEAGRFDAPGGFALGALEVEAVVTGWSTNLIFSNGIATRCSPMPRKPPTPITTALMLPLLSINSSLMAPMFSSLLL